MAIIQFNSTKQNREEKLERDIMNKYTECGYVVGTGLKDKLDSGSYRDIIELIICEVRFCQLND